MTRGLLNLLTMLSLLLCVAVCVLWVRSGITKDSLRRSMGASRLYAVKSYRGALLLSRVDFATDSDAASLFSTIRWDADPVRPELGYDDNGDSIDSIVWRKAGRLRLGYSAERFFGGSVRTVVVPLWLIASVTAILPSFLAFRQCRHAWRRRGSRCHSCGYDLRATPDRCPECGTPADGGGTIAM